MNDRLFGATRFFVPVALITFLVGYAFAPLEVDPHHDGLVFKIAYDAYHGAIPFKDSFSQYGLFLTILHVGVLKIFGLKLEFLRIFTIVGYAITASLLWLIWRRLLSAWLALLAVALWFSLAPFYSQVLLPWSSATALPFQAGAILLMMNYARKHSAAPLFFASVLVAFVFWLRMPVGVLMILAQFSVVFYLAFVEGRLLRGAARVEFEFAVIIGGFLIASIPFALFLWVNDAYKDWFSQTFLLALTFSTDLPTAWYGDRSVFSSIVQSFFPTHMRFVWIVLPVASIIAALVCMANNLFVPSTRKDSKFAEIFTLATFCLASWPQYYPVTEERHVFWAATPMVGVALYVGREMIAWIANLLATPQVWSFFAIPVASLGNRLGRFQRLLVSKLQTYRAIGIWLGNTLRRFNLLARPRIVAVATVVLAIAVCAPVIQKHYRDGRERLRAFRQVVTKPDVLAGLRVKPQEKLLYETIAKDIEQAMRDFPRSKFINLTRDSLYLTFGEYRPNWHPLFVYFDVGLAIYPDFPRKLEEFIHEHHPIVLTTGFDLRHENYNVIAHYSNGVSLLTRRPEALQPAFLRPLPQDKPSFHIYNNNRFNLTSPLRYVGPRLPSVRLGDEATIEFVFRSNRVEGTRATLFTNLFGRNPQEGFSVSRAPRDNEYRFVVGSTEGQPVELLRFRVKVLGCSYVVIRRNKDEWNVWVDGRTGDMAQYDRAAVASDAPLVINNGFVLAEYHVGILYEIRILDRVLTPAEVIANSRYAHDRCISSEAITDN